MLTNLSNTLRRYANGWLVIVFFVVTVSFQFGFFIQQQARIVEDSGGTQPIDLQFFYTPQKVYRMISTYSDELRASYRVFELTFDIAYPIAYTLFFSFAITWLFQRSFASDSKMHGYNVVPFGAWLFDLLENIGIVAMLSFYPSTPVLLAWVSTFFTTVKWLFVIESVGLLLVGLFMASRTGFKKQA